MVFLYALSLWWLVPILGGILILYLLKMRRKDMLVPATFLWPKLTSDVRANAPIQRLRITLLFLLQLLIAAAVVFALAGPLHRARGLSGASTVIVLDDSTAMSAMDVAPNRFEAAVARVTNLVESMTASDRVAVISAGSDTRIVSPLSSDKPAIESALKDLRSSDAPGDIGDALRVAAALVAGRPHSRIIVYSDGALPAVRDFSPGQADLIFERIGTSSRNVGITTFDSALAPGGSVQCYAAIHNYDSSPLPVTVTFRTDGSIVDAKQIVAPAGSTVGETFEASAGAHTADISIYTPGDILSSDNHATIFVRGAETTRTLLVTDGDLFLERALSLDPTIALERSTGVPGYERAGTPGGSRYDLVIFDNLPPEPVKAAAVWSLGAPSPTVGVTDDGLSIAPQVQDWSVSDPVMRYVDLKGVAISRAHRVKVAAGAGAKTLAEGKDGPMIVSTQPPGRRTLYTSWSVLDSDFPLRVSFPIFVANSVSWLTTGGGRAAGDRAGLTARPGQTFAVAAPGGSAKLIKPDGSSEPLDASSGAVTIRDADRVGAYRVVGPEVNTSIAVNLLDEEAGDVRPRSSLTLSGATVSAQQSSGLTLAEIWRPIVVAVLFLMAIEWWVFARRS